jgi:hypothetical protein
MTIPDPKLIGTYPGTYNQVDRSKQYTRAEAPELLRSLNEAWSKIRMLEASSLRKDAVIADQNQRIGRYRVGYTTLIAIITGVCWEGVRALVPMVWGLLR